MSNIFLQRHVPESKLKDEIPDSRNHLQVRNLMNRHISISRNTPVFFLTFSGPDEVELARARAMAVDLVETVRQSYEAHRNGGPQPSAVHYQPEQQAPAQIQAPPSASPPGASSSLASYGAYSAAPGAAPGTAPGADPYAAYGGYQQYQQYCTYHPPLFANFRCILLRPTTIISSSWRLWVPTEWILRKWLSTAS
jgi:hypothetical protein